jgi:hypothetical protein
VSQASARGADDPKLAYFQKNVRPILQSCVRCHSGDDSPNGLDLTTRANALKGGESGPALKPNDAARSLLYQMVLSKAMPPKRPVSAEQLAALRQWIQDGAVWEGKIEKGEKTTDASRAGPDWWSLQPIKRPQPPTVRAKEWVHNPIDAFVLAALESRHLEPAPPADRAALLRRVTYDLHGLPPTPEEIDAFVQDKDANAYEKVIDRLLASPRYGERWGRHWLDVVRFGESNGFERDALRDHAWRYRDYVIRAFNDDKPYPQFVKEQLAGDVIEPVTQDGIVATGFLVCGPWDDVGNMVTASTLLKLRVREEELEEMLAAVGQTFLGMTVNCARCHDHKFDPILQKDYYRLKAVFEGVRYGNRPMLTPEQQRASDAASADVKQRIAETENRLASLEKGEVVERRQLLKELAWQRDTLAALQQPPLTYAAIPSPAPPTHVLVRGDVEKKGEQVGAGGLSVLKTPSSDFDLKFDVPEGERRRKFAAWVAHPDNPLPARVMVNRVWHYHFGRGIVASPNDFGYNGERSTHPELLDWLAGEFIANGWSVKKLHKLILLSATYRQASSFNEKAAAEDADNLWLWRFAPRRLEAEAVRDAMLSVSGKLNEELGGPSFRPFTIRIFNSHFYTLTDPLGPEFNRRTVYRINVNSAKSPFLDAFDCPDPSTKTPRRGVTTTPLQALGLMNNPFVLRQARCFAERVKKEAGNDAEEQVNRAYWLAFGRSPTKTETERAATLTKEHGLESLCWVLLNASEFLYVK